MGGGASQLHTTVQEHHDIKEISLAELSAEVFSSPSVQVSVIIVTYNWVVKYTSCSTIQCSDNDGDVCIFEHSFFIAVLRCE